VAGGGRMAMVEEAEWRRKMAAAWRKVTTKLEKGGQQRCRNPNCTMFSVFKTHLKVG